MSLAAAAAAAVDAWFVRVWYVKRVVLSRSFEISKSIVSFVFGIGILHGIISCLMGRFPTTDSMVQCYISVDTIQNRLNHDEKVLYSYSIQSRVIPPYVITSQNISCHIHQPSHICTDYTSFSTTPFSTTTC